MDNNDGVNNEREEFRRRITRYWWRLSFVVALLFVLDLFIGAFLSALTIRYWFAELEKSDIANILANIILLLVLPLIIVTWIITGIRLRIKVLASVLAILVSVTVVINTFIQTFSSEHGFFVEHYVDSATLGDDVYHLTFSAGISGGMPAYHMYRCDRFGLVCSERSIVNVPAHQVLVPDEGYYPTYTTLLVPDVERGTLYIQEGENIIHEYIPPLVPSP